MTTTQNGQDVRMGIASVRPANLDTNRANVEWVRISEVLPNPLNPRKDDSIKTEEMQNIIKSKGWEEPLTVYKKGRTYVLLSGHRRYFAANQAGIKQVPVYIVEPPKNHQDEIERIASLQSGRVDWTPLEWMRFTYERWIAWGQPGIVTFAKQINLKKSQVQMYVEVLSFYPMEEIQGALRTKRYTVSQLWDLVKWLKAAFKKHPTVVEDLSEDMIRRVMLEKLENKKVNAETLRRMEFVQVISSDYFKRFVMNKEQTLEQCMENVQYSMSQKSFQGSVVSMGWAKKNVQNIAPRTEEQAKKSAELLADLKIQIEQQLANIEKKFPDAVLKDRLF